VIRDIGAEDIPWCVALGRSRYDMRLYDEGGGLVALTQAMRLPTALAWRNDHSFLVANTQVRAWAPRHRTLHILALCTEEGHHWAAVELLRGSVEWARAQGCDRWWLASETEHGVEALARRIGARAMPGWAIDLKEPQHDECILGRRRSGR
jgi:hypothetical protein